MPSKDLREVDASRCNHRPRGMALRGQATILIVMVCCSLYRSVYVVFAVVVALTTIN